MNLQPFKAAALSLNDPAKKEGGCVVSLKTEITSHFFFVEQFFVENELIIVSSWVMKSRKQLLVPIRKGMNSVQVTELL